MIKIKYDMNLMKFISLFESITRTNLDDAFLLNDTIYFIVREGEIGKAVGKKGINYKKLEGILKRNIKIIENSKELNKFVQNVVYPYKLANIETDYKKLTMTAIDTKTRGMLIGRGGTSLRTVESIVKRYFEIDEIKVV